MVIGLQTEIYIGRSGQDEPEGLVGRPEHGRRADDRMLSSSFLWLHVEYGIEYLAHGRLLQLTDVLMGRDRAGCLEGIIYSPDLLKDGAITPHFADEGTAAEQSQ